MTYDLHLLIHSYILNLWTWWIQTPPVQTQFIGRLYSSPPKCMSTIAQTSGGKLSRWRGAEWKISAFGNVGFKCWLQAVQTFEHSGLKGDVSKILRIWRCKPCTDWITDCVMGTKGNFSSSITGNHWESLGITENHWESLGITGNHWESLGITENHWESLRITGNHWKSLRITENHWESLGITGNHWVLYCITYRDLRPRLDEQQSRKTVPQTNPGRLKTSITNSSLMKPLLNSLDLDFDLHQIEHTHELFPENLFCV